MYRRTCPLGTGVLEYGTRNESYVGGKEKAVNK